ncbi:MAG: hypothetical protein ABUJ92_14280 [Desulfobacterales bacterium]
MKKQSQFASLLPEIYALGILSTKLEILKRCLTEHNLKKQSQFTNGQFGANSLLKGDYVEFHALRRQKNKAKQSQFPRSP